MIKNVYKLLFQAQFTHFTNEEITDERGGTLSLSRGSQSGSISNLLQILFPWYLAASGYHTTYCHLPGILLFIVSSGKGLCLPFYR